MNALLRFLFSLAFAVLLKASPATAAEPLFPNSVVSNDLDFILTQDPSVSFEITETGLARREMPDKRSDLLFLDAVSTFRLNYEDGAHVEVCASPELRERGVAHYYVARVGAALGKQPYGMRKILSHVVIHSGDEVAFAEENGHFFVLYSENIDRRISTHDLEETVFHESVHATLEKAHARHPDWIAAQQNDPGFITEYAARLPEKEDLSESALFAYALMKSPGRLPSHIETAVREIMPQRLAYLHALFATLEPETE